jgi:hypothetical protein
MCDGGRRGDTIGGIDRRTIGVVPHRLMRAVSPRRESIVSFPLSFPRSLAALVAVSGFAVAASLAPPPALADTDPHTIPKMLDVPPDHPWRQDTRLAYSTAAALPGHNAVEARRMAVANLVKSSPKALRPYLHVGPVHRHRFTVTIVGDQACAFYRPGRPHVAKVGPCAPSDRIRLASPRRATAFVVGFAYDDSLGDVHRHRARVRLISNLFSRRTLANVAWSYAPRGVGVAGLIDHNEDGLDDDARITLHSDGHVTCLRLGVYPGQKSTYSAGICRNLEPRRIHYPPRRATLSPWVVGSPAPAPSYVTTRDGSWWFVVGMPRPRACGRFPAAGSR